MTVYYTGDCDDDGAAAAPDEEPHVLRPVGALGSGGVLLALRADPTPHRTQQEGLQENHRQPGRHLGILPSGNLHCNVVHTCMVDYYTLAQGIMRLMLDPRAPGTAWGSVPKGSIKPMSPSDKM